MAKFSWLAAVYVIASGSVLSTTSALAHYGGGEDGHMMGWGGWFVGPLMMLGGLAILIAAVLFIVRLTTGNGGNTGPQDDAMQILRERFAKGEINEAQFTQMKQNLEQKG